MNIPKVNWIKCLILLKTNTLDAHTHQILTLNIKEYSLYISTAYLCNKNVSPSGLVSKLCSNDYSHEWSTYAPL